MNHLVGATLSSSVAVTTATMTPVVTAIQPASPMSSPQLSPLSSPYASPSTSSTCHLGDCSGSACSGSGGCAVPPSVTDWLKKIRLHKYTDKLSRYSLEEVGSSFNSQNLPHQFILFQYFSHKAKQPSIYYNVLVCSCSCCVYSFGKSARETRLISFLQGD